MTTTQLLQSRSLRGLLLAAQRLTQGIDPTSVVWFISGSDFVSGRKLILEPAKLDSAALGSARGTISADEGWGATVAAIAQSHLGGDLETRLMVPIARPDGAMGVLGVAASPLSADNCALRDLVESCAAVAKLIAERQEVDQQILAMRQIASFPQKRLLLASSDGRILFVAPALAPELGILGANYRHLKSAEGTILPEIITAGIAGAHTHVRIGNTATVLLSISRRDGWSLAKPLIILEFLIEASIRGAKLDPSRLSKAETEIVNLVRQGLSNAEIATVRGTSTATVKNQLHAVYERTGIPHRKALMAARPNPIPPPLQQMELPDIHATPRSG